MHLVNKSRRPVELFAFATAFMVMGVKQSKQFAKTHSEIEIYLVYTTKDGAWETFVSPNMQNRIIN